MELKATNGKLLPALTVFSESLLYPKEHALNTIKESSFQTVYDQEITWVITVPATWSAAAKQLMRLAARVKSRGYPISSNYLWRFLCPSRQRNSSICKQCVFQISVHWAEKSSTLRVVRERMSPNGSNNKSTLSPHRRVEMSPTEISMSCWGVNSLPSRWCSCSSNLIHFP